MEETMQPNQPLSLSLTLHTITHAVWIQINNINSRQKPEGGTVIIQRAAPFLYTKKSLTFHYFRLNYTGFL